MLRRYTIKIPQLFNEDIIAPWGFGVHSGIADKDYYAIKAVSKSAMPHAMRSMKHLLTYFNEENTTTADQYKGQLLHKVFLEPKWSEQNMILTEHKSKATKAYKEEVALNPGKLVLNNTESRMVEGARRAFSGDVSADQVPIFKALSSGKTEVSLFAKDPETGLILRGRTDFLSDDDFMTVDYKTTGDARVFIEQNIDAEVPTKYSQFQKTALDFHYHVQVAFYQFLLELCGCPKKYFVFVTQEKTEPFDFTFSELNQDWIDEGKIMYREALNLIAKAAKDGDWSGYKKHVYTMNLPHWGINKGWN